MENLVVRAIDVGYGHVKWTEGREGEEIRVDSFPSQSPAVSGRHIESDILQRRDTFRVPVGGRLFEVGRHVRMALSGNQETEVLDENFPLSDAYAARLFGALNYMLPGLPGKTIDYLVLGLPLTTFDKLAKDLSKKFTGELVINEKGTVVQVRRCAVYPQPLGSYVTYLNENKHTANSAPMALIIDPGFNTIDWYVCEGLVANTGVSKAIVRGVSSVLREIARSVMKDFSSAGSESEVVRLIDQALIHGKELRLFGKAVDLAKHMAAGNGILDEAAQAIRNAVGPATAIDEIIVTGGGAKMYAPAIASKFPEHAIAVLSDPGLANARGFHLIGENLAASAQRARGG